MRTIILLLIMAVIGGCVPHSNISTGDFIRLDSMTGVHYTEIMNLWGPPTSREPDGMGGEILTWTEDRVLHAPHDTHILSSDIAERDNSFFKTNEEDSTPRDSSTERPTAGNHSFLERLPVQSPTAD
jgi:hypothetical protein